MAKDVCEILEMSDTRRSIARLDEGERLLTPPTDSSGGIQDRLVINELGLMRRIMRSNKEGQIVPTAGVHDAVPQIKRTPDITKIDQSPFHALFIPIVFTYARSITLASSIFAFSFSQACSSVSAANRNLESEM